jgi:DNA polymerase-1
VSDAARPRLLLIDGHSMAFRAFFGLPVDNFRTTTGEATNAVYGFIAMLTTLLREEVPTHIAVAFDIGRTTFRTEQYAAYKGTREATPEEFKSQIPLIKEVLDALRITSVEQESFEADDIIATLSTRAHDAGMEVLICSGDRDTFQLVTNLVTVLYPRKGVSDLVRMTPAAVEEKYGLAPARYPDLAALVGETSDNLPGVPGVGPKTAAKWIQQYGDLDGVLAAAAEIPGKAGESLRANLDQVVLNRHLNALVTDMTLPVDLDDLEARPWDREAVHRVFDALQFKTLRERLLAMVPDGAEGAAGFELEVARSSATSVREWLAERGSLMLGLDVTGRGAPAEPDAWAVAIADGRGAALAIDLTELSDDDDAALGGWLADPAAAKALNGAKGAWHELGARGWALAGVRMDTQLAGYLCHPDQRGYDLGDLTARYLHRDLRVEEAGHDGQATLDLALDEKAVDSAAALRAAAVVELADVLAGALADRNGAALLRDVELPLVDTLGRMERAGIAVDEDYLRGLEKYFGAEVDKAAAEAYQVIGHEVNLGSPKQLQDVLFDELGMPKTKRIKTGYTTDAGALTELFERTEHPFLAHLLAHRDAIRLRQTVEGLLRSIAADGRIHTTFNQTIAATGRLSSTDPNLQNIPIRTEDGRRIRRAFVVGAGFETLLTADYSQIEMRLMAHLSGDQALIEAFRSGEDLHSYVGSRVFGVPADKVTPKMRSKIKAMSYGLAYGLSAFGLSKQLKISVSEANALMDDYFARFGGVRDYLAGVVEEARKTGYTETIRGRRRYLPDLTSDNRQRRDMAERMALNAPMQGSAADIIKVAMLGVDRALASAGLASRMLLQVHDELVIEVAPGEREKVEGLVRTEMGAAADLSVALDVSVGVGRNWHEAGH